MAPIVDRMRAAFFAQTGDAGVATRRAEVEPDRQAGRPGGPRAPGSHRAAHLSGLRRTGRAVDRSVRAVPRQRRRPPAPPAALPGPARGAETEPGCATRSLRLHAFRDAHRSADRRSMTGRAAPGAVLSRRGTEPLSLTVMPVSEAAVLDALKAVTDPDLGRDIVALGFRQEPRHRRRWRRVRNRADHACLSTKESRTRCASRPAPRSPRSTAWMPSTSR